MSHYEFLCLSCLANVDLTNFGGLNDMVSMVQCRGITKNDGSTPTTTVSEFKDKEKKRQYCKRKLDME